MFYNRLADDSDDFKKKAKVVAEQNRKLMAMMVWSTILVCIYASMIHNLYRLTS